MSVGPQNPSREHARKYTEDAYLSIEALRGWRYWKVKQKRFWHREITMPLWLQSPTTCDRWLPGDLQIAGCNNFDPRRVWRETGRRILIFITIAIFMMMVIAGLIQQIFPPEDPAQYIMHPPVLRTFLVVWLGFIMLVLFAMNLNPLINRIRVMRNPDAKHEAPAKNCMCGLYAAYRLNALFAEFSDLRAAARGKGKDPLVVGQVKTGQRIDRAFGGSVGFRATSMRMTADPLYLLNGTPEMAAELSRLYLRDVIVGPPPIPLDENWTD